MKFQILLNNKKYQIEVDEITFKDTRRKLQLQPAGALNFLITNFPNFLEMYFAFFEYKEVQYVCTDRYVVLEHKDGSEKLNLSALFSIYMEKIAYDYPYVKDDSVFA